VLARLGRDDRRVQREQVGLLGHVVDHVQDLTDGVDARTEVRNHRHGFLAALLDAVNFADRLQDRFCAALSVLGDFFGQARRLVGVRLNLVDGDVHLVHARGGFLGGERERIDVLGDFLDRVGHLFDRGHGFAHAGRELEDVATHLLVGSRHLQHGGARFLGAGR
jgi:hypothetical protein